MNRSIALLGSIQKWCLMFFWFFFEPHPKLIWFCPISAHPPILWCPICPILLYPPKQSNIIYVFILLITINSEVGRGHPKMVMKVHLFYRNWVNRGRLKRFESCCYVNCEDRKSSIKLWENFVIRKDVWKRYQHLG